MNSVLRVLAVVMLAKLVVAAVEQQTMSKVAVEIEVNAAAILSVEVRPKMRAMITMMTMPSRAVVVVLVSLFCAEYSRNYCLDCQERVDAVVSGECSVQHYYFCCYCRHQQRRQGE